MNKEDAVCYGKISKVERYKWEIVDKPGTFIPLHKHMLKIDDTYQRDASSIRVLSIARQWSWVAFGAVVVARRKICNDGINEAIYYVIDGQHRVAAALLRNDISVVPCIVFDLSGTVDEATGFLGSNTNRKGISSIDKFKALLFLKNPEAVLVDRLSIQYGRKLDHTTSSSTISCAGALLKWAKSNPDVLIKMWPIISEICTGNIFHEKILEGIMFLESNMINHGHSLSDKKWKERLFKIGYNTLLDATAKASAFYSRGGSKVWASGILEAINKGLSIKLETKNNI